jgi:hypothetical protein
MRCSAITPSTGSTAGGTSVTISGTNLSGATGVTIGGAACTSLSANTATSVTCLTPAGTGLNKAVVVTTTSGPSTGSVSFSYNGPSVSGITPKYRQHSRGHQRHHQRQQPAQRHGHHHWR